MQDIRSMSFEEFLDKYSRTVDGLTRMYMAADGLDEDIAMLKAIEELAADKDIVIWNLDDFDFKN